MQDHELQWDSIDWCAAFRSTNSIVEVTTNITLGGGGYTVEEGTGDDDVIDAVDRVWRIVSPSGPRMVVSNETSEKGNLHWCWTCDAEHNGNWELGVVTEQYFQERKDRYCLFAQAAKHKSDAVGFRARGIAGSTLTPLDGIEEGTAEVYINTVANTAVFRVRKNEVTEVRCVALPWNCAVMPCRLVLTTWLSCTLTRHWSSPFDIPIEQLQPPEAEAPAYENE